MAASPRLLIIGLDCAEPSLVFDRWAGDLPHLSRLMQQGSFGRLESCVPAITVPAWSCMMSGRDPGELGIYGFRNRTDRSYQQMAVADSRFVQEPRLWNILGDAGWRVAVLGVPGTYPPQPVNGVLVAGFLAPNTQVDYTFPPELSSQIAAWVGDYLLDVPNFRATDKSRILADIYTLCRQRFAVAHHLLDTYQPDMLMLVEMGVDRIQHAFWRQMDPQHPEFVPGSPHADAIHAYYRYIDQHIGELLSRCDEQTAIMVVSDHGARPLMGGFCLNEWLIATGYLVLQQSPTGLQSLDEVAVDWSRTRAWGAGGYYGRLFLNVRGREPHGVIAPSEYEHTRVLLAEQLRSLPGPDGQPMRNRVFTPQQLYRKVRGIAPDLLIYFGDLAWRSVGKVGTGTLFTQENDTGPDDANHAQHGLFIWYDPQRPGSGKRLDDARIYDILPSLLAHFKVSASPGLGGKVLDW